MIGEGLPAKPSGASSLSAVAVLSKSSAPAAPSFARRFLQMGESALRPNERADVASALARAYLYSDLTTEMRDEVALAMTALLDDQDRDVRRALAEALAGADRDAEAPRDRARQ